MYVNDCRSPESMKFWTDIAIEQPKEKILEWYLSNISDTMLYQKFTEQHPESTKTGRPFFTPEEAETMTAAYFKVLGVYAARFMQRKEITE